MTLYADLDISVIREYPEGHRPVQTRIMPRAQKREVYEILKQRLSAGEQAFVVCPVIEASEELDLKDALEMHAALKKLFSGSHRIGLVHGRLGAEEKGRVTRAFREGEIDLLVGTTVIEVGVDAPGATVMIIEHPERFGLSQLHQLRGRVGRGSKQGLCLLMISDGLSSEARERLEILARTTDGFEIAQKDLELRGHGELMGLRQTGAGELDLGEVFREPELLMAAKEEAEGILQGDPTLARPEHRFMRQRVVPGDGRIDL
jgi:ATP-dependent DNA helicase RecG